jgi:F-type H+-transporting ATPase subunit b
MKKILISLNLFFIPIVLFASEHGEAQGPNYKEFGFRVLTFAIFAFILVKLLKNPIKNLLSNRTGEIEKAINDAVEAKKSAEAELENYKSKLKDMEKDLEEMKAKALKATEAEKEEIIKEAEKTIEKLKAFTETMIQSELNQAKESLRKEALMLSLKIAEEKLSSELKGKAQDALLKEYINKIGANN